MRRAVIGLMALISSSLTHAGPEVIIPSKAIDHLFYLYKDYSIVNQEVKVTGQNFTRTGPNSLTHDEKGHKATIPFSSFSFYRYLGASVFRAQTGTGTGSGTASLIGKNIVLTNKHVLSTDNDKKSCGKFTIYLDDNETKPVTCKKVLYCDVQDFCVAEMNKYEDLELSEIVRPISIQSTQESKSKKLIIVGNALGLGIQGSSGKTYQYVKKDQVARNFLFTENVLIHHTPTLSGSSGSPVFNEKGIMVGLNYANNSQKGYVDEAAFNMAVPSPYLLQKLKTNIPKEAFDSISQDQAPSEDIISQYEIELKDSFDLEDDVQLSDDLIIQAMKINSTERISAEINDQLKLLKARLVNLSMRELEFLAGAMSNSKLAQISKINSALNDWTLSRDAEKICSDKKDLTLLCKQDHVLKKVQALSPLLSREIIQARLKFSETTVHDVLNHIRSDKALFVKIFKGCLETVSKVSNSGGTIFYGNSSSVNHSNPRCQDLLVSEIKATGLKWTANIGSNQEIASMIGANTDLSRIQDSFEKMVGLKWQYGLLGKSGTKKAKVDNNRAALKSWVDTLASDNNLDEWFNLINPKMRKSIL